MLIVNEQIEADRMLVATNDKQYDFLVGSLSRRWSNNNTTHYAIVSCRLATVTGIDTPVPMLLRSCASCGERHGCVYFNKLLLNTLYHTHSAKCPTTDEYIFMFMDPDYYITYQ